MQFRLAPLEHVASIWHRFSLPEIKIFKKNAKRNPPVERDKQQGAASPTYRPSTQLSPSRFNVFAGAKSLTRRAPTQTHANQCELFRISHWRSSRRYSFRRGSILIRIFLFYLKGPALSASGDETKMYPPADTLDQSRKTRERFPHAAV